ncbi:PAS domain S-box protein [Gigaspora margarita]|uniref:histidine kinase n=1 Tax=Gigaspora margarita TaxID=4874 RepID=A0A8H3ZZ56_GIGMA|nr:PAS domain S-box protein [Gigaspora margarita]
MSETKQSEYIWTKPWSGYMSLLGDESTGDSDLYSDEIPVNELVYSFDWSKTPLGPMSSWAPSLKSTVDLCLHSVFPIAVYCGPELILIYNQMYRPILKTKHPNAMGLPAKEAWSEIYDDDLGPKFQEVMTTGQGLFRDDNLMLIHREGYIEECYFSYTLSPIFEADGSVNGVFNAVQETTQRILATRRLKTLGELGNRTPGAKTVESSCHMVAATLRDNDEDIPFAIIYLIESDESNNKIRMARLVSTTFDEELETIAGSDGVDEYVFTKGRSKRILPDYLSDIQDNITITIEDNNNNNNNNNNMELSISSNVQATSSHDTSFHIQHVVRTGEHAIITLSNGCKAILLPVATSTGKNVLTSVMICGINPRRALDREYMGFLQLVVGHVSSSMTHGKSREEERKQAEMLADLNRQKINFFQNISHEFRTPLTLMLSPLEEAISMCSPDSPILPNLQLINRNARRLLKLVNTLLQFSRMEAGRLEARFQKTDIAKITLELASCFESMARSLQLDYIIDIQNQKEFDEKLEREVFIDHDMYEKIVFNLCSNAFKHTWTGNVTVRLRELYLEESHQWIQTKQRPDYDDNDPDVVMQGEGDKDAMDIDDDFEADLGKRMSMSSIDDEKTKKYQFPFDDMSVDLVLSDIMMPNMNGYQLLSAIRNDPILQLIPVILLSAKAGEEASIQGLEKGADDYLTKPFSARDLIARVRVNIRLSYLRQQLLLQQRRQSETKQLLFSISNKIRSGLSLDKTLTTAVEEILRILPSDRVFILASENQNFANHEIMAYAAADPNEQNMKGLKFQYTYGGDVQAEAEASTTASSEGIKPLLEHIIKDSLDYSRETDVTVLLNFSSLVANKPVSLISIPIRENSITWGWLVANRPPNTQWMNSEKTFLQQITNQISLAITHAKLMEEKLKREAQIEAAKAANEAKSRILANTSHELRTPLGAIIGVLSAFEDTPLTEDQKDMVHIMTRASDVVLSVVNDILDAAKLEAQKITLVNRTFDLFDFMEKTIELFGENAGNKQIELILCCDPDSLPKYVKSDPERLQQVLINLLSNSLKFTDNGEVVLKVSLEEIEEESSSSSDENAAKKGRLCVEVIDSGIGIDPAFIKSIWESFSQGDQSMTRRQDGTGLGLSICKHLVTINGGLIDVESEVKKGSRFWFTWNIERLSLSAVPITTMSQPSDFSHSSGRSKRVLIIDYSFLSRQTLVKLIEGSVEKVNSFSSCEECITSVKTWKEQYNNESLFDIAFFNVRENISEEIKNAAKELRRICDNNICIVLIVFWSANGRTLGNNLVQEIGGKTWMICKPVMQKRLLHCLSSKDFVSEPYAPPIQHEYYSSVKPLADLRIEDFYRNNRPPFSEEKDLIIPKESSSSNTEKSQIIVPSEETVKPNVERMESDDLLQPITESSTVKDKGKGKSVEPTQLGVKRMAHDETENASASTDDRASKFRFRPVSKSKCILCVEDNPINLKVIQHQLSKLGYPSLCATNGQEAVNLIESEYSNYSSTSEDSNPGRISLILMDCAMPIMSGFDASRAIRAMNTPISNVPIIALTASAVQGTKEQCLESGMNDYLTKPLKIAKLKEMLEQWLGSNESNE